MSFKPSGWMWILGTAALLLVLLIVLLLRHGADSASLAPPGAGGTRPGLRKPFPEGGELGGVPRPTTLQPRKQLPPDPQFQRPQRQ
jgi:hypothetical protein